MKNCLNYAYLKYIIAKRYNNKNLEKFREGKFFPKFLSSKNIRAIVPFTFHKNT